MITIYNYKGVTLLELTVVIAIASILLAVAVPSFSSLVRGSQIASNTNDFVGTLRRAKIESSSKLATTTICVRANDTCSSDVDASWQDGWIVFLDADADGIKDAGEGLIYEYEAMGSQITFKATDDENSSITKISFDPYGTTTLSISDGLVPPGLTTTTGEATFAMCDTDRGNRKGIRLTVAGQSSPIENIAATTCS
jgi:type IV fimbrial biogenesis protein FimT